MSQTWSDDVYDPDATAAINLQAMENNFASLKSNFSGAASPANPTPGQLFFDTAKKLLKHRNQADSAWRGIMAGSASFKIWAYLAAAEDGWAIDTSITDRVLAVKSSSGAYATAGATAGSWTITGIVSTHTHTPGNTNTGLAFSEATSGILKGTAVGVESGTGRLYLVTSEGGTDTLYANVLNSCGSHTHTMGNNSAGSTQDGTWRPAAAVGQIMYPDV